MQVYLAIQGQKAGPFSLFQIEEKLKDGEVGTTTLGWYEGLEKWKPLSEMPPFENFFHRQKNEAFQDEPQAKETDEQSEDQAVEVRPWTRFWARRFDELFFFLLCLAVMVALRRFGVVTYSYVAFLENAFGYLLPAYFLLEALCLSRWGATPGKALLGVFVVGEDGDPPSLGQALRRSLSVFVIGLACHLPFLTIITQIWGYRTLKARGTTIWDGSSDLRVVHQPFQMRHVFLPILLIILAFSLLEGPIREIGDYQAQQWSKLWEEARLRTKSWGS